LVGLTAGETSDADSLDAVWDVVNSQDAGWDVVGSNVLGRAVVSCSVVGRVVVGSNAVVGWNVGLTGHLARFPADLCMWCEEILSQMPGG
jgi:hypothetical protein